MTAPKEPKAPLPVYAEYLHEDECWIIDVPSKWVIGRIHSGPLAAAIEEIALPEEGQPVQLLDMVGERMMYDGEVEGDVA